MRVITALVVRAVASYGRYEFFISLCKRPAASEAKVPPANLLCSKWPPGLSNQSSQWSSALWIWPHANWNSRFSESRSALQACLSSRITGAARGTRGINKFSCHALVSGKHSGTGHHLSTYFAQTRSGLRFKSISIQTEISEKKKETRLVSQSLVGEGQADTWRLGHSEKNAVFHCHRPVLFSRMWDTKPMCDTGSKVPYFSRLTQRTGSWSRNRLEYVGGFRSYTDLDIWA